MCHWLSTRHELYAPARFLTSEREQPNNKQLRASYGSWWTEGFYIMNEWTIKWLPSELKYIALSKLRDSQDIQFKNEWENSWEKGSIHSLMTTNVQAHYLLGRRTTSAGFAVLALADRLVAPLMPADTRCKHFIQACTVFGIQQVDMIGVGRRVMVADIGVTVRMAMVIVITVIMIVIMWVAIMIAVIAKQRWWWRAMSIQVSAKA